MVSCVRRVWNESDIYFKKMKLTTYDFLLKFFIFYTASMFYSANCDKNAGKCCYSRLPTVGGERSDASCCHVRRLAGNVTEVSKAGFR